VFIPQKHPKNIIFDLIFVKNHSKTHLFYQKTAVKINFFNDKTANLCYRWYTHFSQITSQY